MTIITMITLLILNGIIKTLVIDIAHITTIEAWGTTTDAKYTIIMMISV